jgi:hypothetical protein
MALHGTSKRYIVQRLEREGETALLAAVLANKITALTAATSLGWVKRPPLKGGSTHRAHRREFELRAIDGELSPGAKMELWLGPNPSGSYFKSREALVEAWRTYRAEIMARWGSHGRRPAGFYEFEFDGPRPAYAVERSTLWRLGALSESERLELEDAWKAEFDAVRGQDAHARREHYEHHDIPDELVREWTARRRPRAVREPRKDGDAA